ncbi:hypothetical protein AAG570_001789 [Ranatra chinensis]|uniref:Uncharacterized protein n=1 Tax=Ranatra chinensis TaxID=642074 RepID=A0ABD0YXT5_9HEMI
MDMMLMEQHFLRSPLRLYSEMDAENNNGCSSGVGGGLVPATMMEKGEVYPLLVGGGRIPLGAHLWGPHWPPGPPSGPPLPLPMAPLPRPPQLTPPTTPSSSGSPSPSPRPVTHRYSPYHVQASPARN